MLQAQLTLTGDLQEISQIASVLSASGIKLPTPVVVEPVADDEPVKPAAKAVKPKAAKPAPVEEPEAEEPAASEVVADFSDEEEETPLTLDFLTNTAKKIAVDPVKREKVRALLAKYSDKSGTTVTGLSKLQPADYQSFYTQLQTLR